MFCRDARGDLGLDCGRALLHALLELGVQGTDLSPHPSTHADFAVDGEPGQQYEDRPHKSASNRDESRQAPRCPGLLTAFVQQSRLFGLHLLDSAAYGVHYSLALLDLARARNGAYVPPRSHQFIGKCEGCGDLRLKYVEPPLLIGIVRCQMPQRAEVLVDGAAGGFVVRQQQVLPRKRKASGTGFQFDCMFNRDVKRPHHGVGVGDEVRFLRRQARTAPGKETDQAGQQHGQDESDNHPAPEQSFHARRPLQTRIGSVHHAAQLAAIK